LIHDCDTAVPMYIACDPPYSKVQSQTHGQTRFREPPALDTNLEYEPGLWLWLKLPSSLKLPLSTSFPKTHALHVGVHSRVAWLLLFTLTVSAIAARTQIVNARRPVQLIYMEIWTPSSQAYPRCLSREAVHNLPDVPRGRCTCP